MVRGMKGGVRLQLHVQHNLCAMYVSSNNADRVTHTNRVVMLPAHCFVCCRPCPFGMTSEAGTTSVDGCVPAAQPCPVGQIAPPDAVSAEECTCLPGFGGERLRGWALGLPQKFLQGLYPGISFVGTCVMLSAGVGRTVWSLPLQPAMKSSSNTTPTINLCLDFMLCVCCAAGEHPTNACKACPPGYWSPGGRVQPCKPCGFGYTSPEGAESADQCVAINACPAGTNFRDAVLRGGLVPTGLQDCVCKPGHGSVTGSAPCKLCPAGTWSPGGNLEECTPCGFGFTSAEGSTSDQDCRPASQMCPIGQWASQNAVSAAECRCYRGFGGGDKATDACSLCPAGTYSANIGTGRCRYGQCYAC